MPCYPLKTHYYYYYYFNEMAYIVDKERLWLIKHMLPVFNCGCKETCVLCLVTFRTGLSSL